VVIELKAGNFRPEHAGKINFYLSAVDDFLRHENDNPSIGIILCQDKQKVTVEYSLRNVNRPIGVSQYKLVESLPSNLKGSLPTIEELEAELSIKTSKLKTKNIATKRKGSRKVPLKK
jgi:YhcG PDDEXK nuclease domain